MSCINFEHTSIDGHTVLRFATDIFTEGLMLLTRSINPSAPTLAPVDQHEQWVAHSEPLDPLHVDLRTASTPH
ncbi:hypothetical protein K466DRAFT_602110 [Polyporus arcularius HHB13444]|uniref:Uncharacterized protein n=1 Tax=Polyporus arcularius HHB13444 TaxID=1314778 RepID=A0A5C3PEL7_9APHY|nr:hypothetical protein K466DRAFT_602110 [Polyporus arcularius HHB13444]